MKSKKWSLIIFLSILFENYSFELEEISTQILEKSSEQPPVQPSNQAQINLCPVEFQHSKGIIKCISIESVHIPAMINETIKSFNTWLPYNNHIRIVLVLDNISFPNYRMPAKFLEINTFIDELLIKNCELKAIAKNAFNTDSLEGLKRLALIGNDIRKFNAKSVVGLGSLEDLILADMPLDEFRALQFASISHLRSLTIQSITNKDFFIRGALHRQLAINELYFNENLIESISEDYFEGFNNVQIMDLSRNRIEFIEENAFNKAKFPDLLSIDLSHNKLTKLDSNFFNGLPEKTQIILGVNPWQCDCDLKNQLQYFAWQKSKGIISSASCESPNKYKGIKLMNLDWEDLCGGYYRLQCNVASKPPVAVHMKEQRLRIVNADDFERMEELILWSEGSQENTTFVLMENKNNLDNKQCQHFSGNTINGKYLKFDQTYRICRFENNVKIISILDCVTFHRGPNLLISPDSKESTVWIYRAERDNIIMYSLICNCVAFLFGIPLAYCIAKLFPVLTRNRNENLYAENSQRIQEVKDRLREVHPIQKRISMQEKLCRAKTVMFAEEAVFGSFDEIEGSSTSVQPPPVPKRTPIENDVE